MPKPLLISRKTGLYVRFFVPTDLRGRLGRRFIFRSLQGAQHDAARLMTTFLDDPVLIAFDSLPASKMLDGAQVALLLACSTRWLEERRSRGQPPPYVMLGDRIVRYAVGPLRQWIQHTIEHAPASPTEYRAEKLAHEFGFDEPILRGGRRKRPR